MKEEIKYQVGKMVKDPRNMTEKERGEWEKECAENAKNYLFSIGQPLVYKRHDGHTVAEYKNGSVQIVR